MKVFFNKEIGNYILSIIEKDFHIYGESYKNIESSIKRIDSGVTIFQESINYENEFKKIVKNEDIYNFLQKYNN